MSSYEKLDEIDQDWQAFRAGDIGADHEFGWYLDQVTSADKNPEFAAHTAGRVRDMFEHWGFEYSEELGIRYSKLARDDPLHEGENEFYGRTVHEAIHSFVNHVEKAAKHGQAAKRLNLQVGPVGTGKSDFDAVVRDYYEDWTRRGGPEWDEDGGAMYTFRWNGLADVIPDQDPLDDSERSRMHQDPLVLIPAEIRGSYLEEINNAFKAKRYVQNLAAEQPLEDVDAAELAVGLQEVAAGNEAPDYVKDLDAELDTVDSVVDDFQEWNAPYTIRNDQGLDPTSRFYFQELLEHGDYDTWSEVVENHVAVERLVASEDDRVALETFEPKSEKNQDETELTGGIDYSKIAQYGEDDPRSWDYAGALARANRGIFSGEELLRLERAQRDTFLHATQEQTIKPKKTPRIDIDELIFGRTNAPWLEKMYDDDEENAFNDRTVRNDWKYPLEYNEQKKVFRKFLDHSDLDAHIEPHTLELAGLFSVLTRIHDPSKQQSPSEVTSLMEKAKVYNGEDLDGKDIDIKKLQDEANEVHDKDEGMFGVGPRPLIDLIEEAITDNNYEGKDYLNPPVMLDYFEDHLAQAGSIPEELEDPEELEALVEMVEDEYHELAREDLRMALAYDEDEIRKQANKYLDHAQAYVTDSPVQDETVGETGPDEKFLGKVEGQLEQSQGQREEFRQTLNNWYGKQARRTSGEVDPLENDRLRRALERKLWEDKKHNINFSGLLISGSGGDDIEDEAKNKWVGNLVDMGYSEDGAEDLITDVGVQVAKEEMESA